MLWRNPAVRLLLLVLAFGVAGMHTLGHHDGHDTAATGHHATAEPVDGPAAASPTGDLDPTQMCLAILTAGALLGLVLTATRLGRRIAARLWRSGVNLAKPATRGPPDLMAATLLVARVTVLRI